MEIVEIYPPYLYSIGEEGEVDAYHQLFDDWTSVDWLVSFFDSHHTQMDPAFWGSAVDPEVASSRTLDEAYEMEDTIIELANNSRDGTIPDFDSYFVPLGGEYAYVWNHTPVKAYGPAKPSLLRLYAIKIEPNCYLLTGGAIKYCKTMAESEELVKELKTIERVKDYLKECGIDTQEDI